MRRISRLEKSVRDRARKLRDTASLGSRLYLTYIMYNSAARKFHTSHARVAHVWRKTPVTNTSVLSIRITKDHDTRAHSFIIFMLRLQITRTAYWLSIWIQ